MARLPKIKHVLTIGAEKYSFKAPDIYGNFAGVTGVVKAPNPDTTVYTSKLTSEDYANGKVMRLKCGSSSGTGTSRITKTFTVVCSLDRAKAALAALEAKTIATTSPAITWDINNAYVPQRRRFS